MTIIIELLDNNTGESVLIADCLVSLMGNQPKSVNRFPLHFNSECTIDTLGIDVTSKIFIDKYRYVLAAGNVNRINRIVELTKHAQSCKEFRDTLDSFYENERTYDQLIYSLHDQPSGQMYKSAYRCTQFKSGHLDITVGGSGTDFLINHLRDITPNQARNVLELAAELVAMMIRREFTDYDFPDHAFGSAYEIFVPTEDGVNRIPYSVIDSICESKMAEDGVYDLINRKRHRLIFCTPHDNGTMFMVCSISKDTISLAYFHANTLNSRKIVDLPFKSVANLIENHDPFFTISLLRHTEVNYAVLPGSYVEFKSGNEKGFELSIRHKELEEGEDKYFSED